MKKITLFAMVPALLLTTETVLAKTKTYDVPCVSSNAKDKVIVLTVGDESSKHSRAKIMPKSPYSGYTGPYLEIQYDEPMKVKQLFWHKKIDRMKGKRSLQPMNLDMLSKIHTVALKSEGLYAPGANTEPQCAYSVKLRDKSGTVIPYKNEGKPATMVLGRPEHLKCLALKGKDMLACTPN